VVAVVMGVVARVVASSAYKLVVGACGTQLG
jgi:hypothetical protein